MALGILFHFEVALERITTLAFQAISCPFYCKRAILICFDTNYAEFLINVNVCCVVDNANRYINSLEISVDDTNSVTSGNICAAHSGSDPAPNTPLVLTCTQTIRGQYVTIRRTGGYQASTLALCDVRVFGNAIGK